MLFARAAALIEKMYLLDDPCSHFIEGTQSILTLPDLMGQVEIIGNIPANKLVLYYEGVYK